MTHRVAKLPRWFFIRYLFLFLGLVVLLGAGVATGLHLRGINRPPWFGWVLALIGAYVAVRTVDRWARVLAGLFAFAVFNGIMGPLAAIRWAWARLPFRVSLGFP